MHLEELTHRLRNELEELDVEKVEVAKSGEAPEGTKGVPDVPVWGSLLVTLATSSGAIPALVGTVQSWLKRHEGRSVTLEIGGDKLQVTGVTSDQQSELINAWLDHHSAKTKTDA
jgi:Effector Associated Constant Component 1